MALLDPATPEEKAASIAEIHRRTVRFLTKRGITVDIPDLEKDELDEVLSAIWDKLEGIDYRALLNGHRLRDEIPEALVFLMTYGVISARYKLIDSKIPRPKNGG